MPKPSEKQKILSQYEKSDEGVKYYFDMLPDILAGIQSPEPALAYCFQRIEAGQRICLYAILMRKHRTDSAITWNIIDDLDITRKNYTEIYDRIVGKSLDQSVIYILKDAVSVRDKITHGKDASRISVLKAVGVCLEYANAFNKAVHADVGFRPFGRLQGVTSSKRPQLDKNISHLVLKGLGLANLKEAKL
jgi:hypothetical protein